MGGWFPERLVTVMQMLEADDADVIVPLLLTMHDRSLVSNG